MEKINKEEIEELSKKLKPFWKEYWNLEGEFRKKVRVLEKKMNKEINPKTTLEFFYCDGECVGIGAENWSDRKWFPLIPDSKFVS